MTTTERSWVSRLKMERTRLGLTQADFARAGGVSTPSQTGYENGKAAPGIDYLAGIARIGVDVQYVITGRPQSAFDWDLFLAVMEAAESWASSRSPCATVAERSDFIRTLYSASEEHRRIDPAVLQALLRLAN